MSDRRSGSGESIQDRAAAHASMIIDSLPEGTLTHFAVYPSVPDSQAGRFVREGTITTDAGGLEGAVEPRLVSGLGWLADQAYAALVHINKSGAPQKIEADMLEPLLDSMPRDRRWSTQKLDEFTTVRLRNALNEMPGLSEALLSNPRTDEGDPLFPPVNPWPKEVISEGGLIVLQDDEESMRWALASTVGAADPNTGTMEVAVTAVAQEQSLASFEVVVHGQRTLYPESSASAEQAAQGLYEAMTELLNIGVDYVHKIRGFY